MLAPTEPAVERAGWRLVRQGAARFADWAVNSEGSSRSSALIRIGIAMLFWSRWAGELLLYMHQSAIGLVLSANFFVATLLLFIGYRSRAAAVWAGAVGLAMFYYFGHELGREPWTHHHTYLLAVAALLLALTPCGRSYSLDRYLAVMRAGREGLPAPVERGNLWGLRLIVVQLTVLYFFSAFDKTSYAFLSGARLEQIFLWYYAGSDYPRPSRLSLDGDDHGLRRRRARIWRSHSACRSAAPGAICSCRVWPFTPSSMSHCRSTLSAPPWRCSISPISMPMPSTG